MPDRDIVLVSQVFPPAVGGSGSLLYNIYRRIEDIRVTAVVDRETCIGPDVPYGRMRMVRTQIDRAQWGLFDPSGWFGHLSLARLIRRLADGDRALVHCGRAQPEGIAAMFAGMVARGPRYVFWAHGEDISTAKSSRQFERTMRLVYRRAAGAIANSENTAALLAREGIPRDQMALIRPGVDTERFREDADDGTCRRSLAHPGECILLSVGRLQRRKGHDLVLRALATLKQAGANARYVIVGDGDERPRLERLCQDLAISHLVSFEGQVTEESLPKYFAACDIFVMPTRVDGHDFEGFGMVYLEAAAAGKVVIGGRNGGVPEAVEDGVTGFLVSGTDVEELATCLKRLMDSDHLRRQMGEAGRRRAVLGFSWDAASAALRAFHRQVGGANNHD
jgi:phosphatidylinositol alpha-1,6-mannosyltransferase